ncbi:MAG: creatininase family protein [Planctomycetes bacterium]|nr:creatininase family protein [Planctomycetota bacterium]
MFSAENTWNEIEDSGVMVAVVPIGATEQHGTNLPLSTDTLLAVPLAEALAERLGAYLVPQMPFGQSEGWLAYPGTVSLSTDTLRAVIGDIVRSLAVNGFTMVVFLSVHGGNDIIADMLGPLEEAYPSVRLIYADMVRVFEKATTAAGVPMAVHADECEASMLLALHGELVGPHPTDNPAPPGGYPRGRARDVSPRGSFGEPSKATKAKGQRIWDAIVPMIVADVVEQLFDGRDGKSQIA